METAQPALFYLCPVHLLVTFAIALIRKEVKSFWNGELVSIFFFWIPSNDFYHVFLSFKSINFQQKMIGLNL